MWNVNELMNKNIEMVFRQRLQSILQQSINLQWNSPILKALQFSIGENEADLHGN